MPVFTVAVSVSSASDPTYPLYLTREPGMAPHGYMGHLALSRRPEDADQRIRRLLDALRTRPDPLLELPPPTPGGSVSPPREMLEDQSSLILGPVTPLRQVNDDSFVVCLFFSPLPSLVLISTPHHASNHK